MFFPRRGRAVHRVVAEQESAIREVELAQPVGQDALRKLHAVVGGVLRERGGNQIDGAGQQEQRGGGQDLHQPRAYRHRAARQAGVMSSGVMVGRITGAGTFLHFAALGMSSPLAPESQLGKHQQHRRLDHENNQQGTRIAGNLFHDSSAEDLFVEVNHGPFLADSNLFLSAVSLVAVCEDGAYVHYLFTGKIISQPSIDPKVKVAEVGARAITLRVW